MNCIKIHHLLFFLVIFSNFSKAQESITLKLNPGSKEEYIYRTEAFLENSLEIKSKSSISYRPNNNNNIVVSESLDMFNVYNEYEEPKFSLDALYEIQSDKFYFQRFLKHATFVRELVPESGKVISSNIDTLLFDAVSRQQLPDDFIGIIDMFQKNEELFYLGRPLEKGKSFTVDRQNASISQSLNVSIPITYTVFDIDSEKTVITSSVNTEVGVYNRGDKVKLKIDGILIIENATGLPIHYAEIVNADNTSMAISITREGFEALTPFHYFKISRDYSDYPYYTEDLKNWADVSGRFKTEEEAHNYLEKSKVEAYIENSESWYSPSSKLYIGVKEQSPELILKINDINCTYCNKEKVNIGIWGDGEVYLRNSESYSFVRDVSTGTDCMVEKLDLDVDLLSYYGVKADTIYRNNDWNSKERTVEFYIADWNEYDIIMTGFYFMAFGKGGKQLTEAQIRIVNPQPKAIAKLLGIDEDELTNEQIWLYSALLDKAHKKILYHQIKFDEPVDKIVLLDYEGITSANKKLEVNNSDKVNERLKERKAERDREIKELEDQNLEEEYIEEEYIEESGVNESVLEEYDYDMSEEVVEETVPEDQIYIIVEEMPVFKEGDDINDNQVGTYISENLKYPKAARKKGIYGRVYVQFVIDPEGFVKNAEIARGVDPIIDKEALRVVKSMPRWERPGKQRGKSVAVRYTVPVSFVPTDDK